MTRALNALAIPASVLLAVSFPQTANAQTTADDAQPGARSSEILIVATPNRTPTSLQRTGSAVTVLTSDDIAKTNPATLVDALRFVPGLDITETGGPGQTTSVRLRGANDGHTLVLVDGIRVNDPSSTSGSFDFATIAPGLIDRIEVLRGPQSALYGSDAIGGVLSITTKRGIGKFKAYGQIEGGSYGTVSGNTGFYGANGPWDYAFAVSAHRSEGFSTYGHRIGRIIRTLPKLEKDALTRYGTYGRIGYNPGENFRVEIGTMATFTRAEYDAAFGPAPDGPGTTSSVFHSSFVKAELDTFDQRLKHKVQLFASRTKRDYNSYFTVNFPPPTGFHEKYRYIGSRVGGEYQGELKLGQFGTFIAGLRYEREMIDSYTQFIVPFPAPETKDVGRGQDTRSAFALWQVPIGERFDLSLGGRIDDVSGSRVFNTWRATAAYRITETGTKLRASIGTGGKAPTLYQLYAPLYGIATLRPERSFGYDIGIDQSLFNGRAKVSVTAFRNEIKDLIDFDFTACPPANPFGCFLNVKRAETQGVEVAGEATLWQDYLTARATYTFMRAVDDSTGLRLARRPDHSGKVALAITPTTKWTIEPSVTLMGKRFSSANQRLRLAPYARFDILTSYRLTDKVDVYLRAENLTNARYQEVYDYGTTGRAVYAGMKATW
jgi:vitamin B12 transporter